MQLIGHSRVAGVPVIQTWSSLPGRGEARAPTEGWHDGASFPIPRREDGVVCRGRKWLAAGLRRTAVKAFQWSDRAEQRGDLWDESQMSDPIEMLQYGRTWFYKRTLENSLCGEV